MFIGDRATPGGTTLAGTAADEREPDWSPDTKWIAYMSNQTGTYQIWAVRPDLTGRHQVTFDSWNKALPSFAPNSKTILFTRHNGNQADLWTVNVDGTGLRQVTKTSAYESQGAFSPDGTKITFTRQSSKANVQDSAVYKMRWDERGATHDSVSPPGDGSDGCLLEQPALSKLAQQRRS